MKTAGLPMALLANLLIWVFIGYKMDSWLNTTPIFIMIGLFYSLFGTIYLYFKKMRKKDE
ncbi:MAG: AtpZ/AtpI family protein [Firmicutes bacterium]|nr:AtpZ/AtpI family protein [Bacillota bacterium]